MPNYLSIFTSEHWRSEIGIVVNIESASTRLILYDQYSRTVDLGIFSFLMISAWEWPFAFNA